MRIKIWEWLGYWAMGLMLFMLTLIVIRWAVEFVSWTTLDSGWAQAIGGIAAIVGTWWTTRYQLTQAERARNIDKMQSDLAIAQIGFDLAVDTSQAIRNVAGKFEEASRRTVPELKIGTERLAALQESLQVFCSKDISPQLYAETLCLHRELAYTITAVIQQNAMATVTNDRAKKATRRAFAVFECKQRMRKILVLANEAAGRSSAIIAEGDDASDTEI